MDDVTGQPERARRGAEEALLQPPLPRGGGLPPRLLANRPFVWLVLAHGLSQFGFWAFFLAIVAQAKFLYGGGAFELGVMFSGFSIAFLILTPLLGMVSDRWSPKGMLIVGQVVAFCSILPALLGDSVTWLYAASVLDGVAAAAIIPARGSMTALLVPEEDLVRANGMLNTASMLAVIVGPVTSGYLLHHGGHRAGYVMTLCAIGLGLVPLLVLPDRRPRGEARGSFAGDLAKGFGVSWRVPELRVLLLLAGSAWFMITVLITLEPVFVEDVLHRDEDELGVLWSSHGLGAFVGALVVTRWRRAAGREVFLLGIALLVGGGGLLLYVGPGIYGVSLLGNAVFGVSFAWFQSLSQALIQRVTAEDMRGRVTGVVGMLQETCALASSVGIAALAGVITTVQPFLLGAAAILGLSGLYGLRAATRLVPPPGPAPPPGGESVTAGRVDGG